MNRDATPPAPSPRRSRPFAVIEKQSTWSWRIYIVDGTIRYGGNDGYGWFRPRRKRAEAKARHELAAYLRRLAEPPERFTIPPGSPGTY